MTQIGDAFAKAGWTKADNDFDKAFALYLNHGGTIARAHWIVDRHNETAGKGHATREIRSTIADPRPPSASLSGTEAHLTIASARGIVPDGGHGEVETQRTSAASQEKGSQPRVETPISSAPKSSRTSHTSFGNRQFDARPAGIPPKRPTVEQRKAALETRTRTAMTLFDTYRVPDGRPIGDVTYNELGLLVGTNMRWMSIFQQIRAHGSPVDANAKIRDIISEPKLKTIIDRSEQIRAEALHEGVLMSPEGKWSLIKGASAL